MILVRISPAFGWELAPANLAGAKYTVERSLFSDFMRTFTLSGEDLLDLWYI